MKIKLNNLDKASRYLTLVEQFNAPIDINVGNISIDGKSIGLLFGLDLNKKLDVEIHTNDKEEERNFYELMKEFSVDET